MRQGAGKGQDLRSAPPVFKTGSLSEGTDIAFASFTAPWFSKNITSAHVESIRRLFEGKKNGRLDLPYGITVYKSYDVGMLQKDDKGVKQGFEEEAGKRNIRFPSPGQFICRGLEQWNLRCFPEIILKIFQKKHIRNGLIMIK